MWQLTTITEENLTLSRPEIKKQLDATPASVKGQSTFSAAIDNRLKVAFRGSNHNQNAYEYATRYEYIFMNAACGSSAI